MNKAGPRQWFGLSILLLPTVLLFLAMTVLFLATPQIAADLDPSGSQLLWINDIYGFMMAGLLVAFGTVGDRIGRRKILLFGAAAFGVASLAASLAPNADLLIAARAVMGVGAAAVMPSTLSLISNMFKDDRQRGTAIGLWAASISVGVAVGPLVGGLLLEAFWWGAALLAGVPVMLVVLVGAPFLIPEYRAPKSGGLDLTSVLLSMLTLLPIVYGVKELAKSGAGVVSLGTLAAGLLFGVIFVRRQLRLENPLLDMRLFANKVFSGALGVFMLSAIALGGVYLLFTQYLQLVAGLSPLEAGLWILPAALALVAVSTLSPVLARRVRPAYVISGGALLSVLGYLLMTQVGSVAGLPMLITGFYVLYPGIAPAMALNTALVIGAAPPEKAGAASAVNTTASDLGTSLGVAVLGTVGTAVYRAAMPAGAPDTLSGALVAAEDLPGQAGAALAAAARAAYTDGLNVAGGIAAALVAGAIVLALTTLRKVPATQHTQAAEPEPATEREEVVAA
ncbi:MFS transporter [Nonomuraea typhae]|uniref:MFS transporter n=1 Tax=Nonomuraea typhae TaxID=2603600 RepID=UPI0012F98FFB|nr:MFS transporter [Nonomuraea typhae]